GDARLAEQFLHHGQQALGMQTRNHLVATEQAPLVQQGNGAGFGGGIQGQQGGHYSVRWGRRAGIISRSVMDRAETTTARKRAVGQARTPISSGRRTPWR